MKDPAAQPASHYPVSQHVEANGLRLHHLDWGNPQGEPVVVLHGIRLHAHCFSHFSRRFRERYHVMALDARGHGDSQWSDDQDYHLQSYYEDLHAVLEARDPQPVILIGHSLGARTSMLYTHLHPERVRRLVLIDMGAGLPHKIESRDFSRITETPPPKDFDSHDEAITYLGGILKLAPEEMIRESVIHGMRKLESGRWTWKYDPSLGGPPRPRDGAREWDLWEAVKTISSPTLLLHGEYSQVVSPEIVERMKATMADCRAEMVPQAGHALFTERPDYFSERVEAFLADR